MPSTICWWQPTQFCWSTATFLGRIMIGSWKSWSVKPLECQNPFSALLRYFAKKPCGVWQSLQEATAWCGDFCQPSNCSRMMWQFMQARGSLEKYESPCA
jgi:hypothetical protein